MASFFQIVIISVSLAIDSLSVSVAGGFKTKKTSIIDAIKVAAFFGGFQAGMPLIGWAIGEVLSTVITEYAHWIAFILLGIIGIKMIKESFENEDGSRINFLSNKTLTLLAIATSIDALIVGITLGLLEMPLLISITLIGTITFVLCFFGFLFGKQLANLFGKRVEIFGGIALVVIGIKILFEKLS